jgi:hypothetical protein
MRMPRGLLGQRIASQPRQMDGHMASHRAAGAGVPPMEMTMPLSVLTVTADGTSIEEATPLYAAKNGAPIPATGTGQWDQLRAAGRA